MNELRRMAYLEAMGIDSYITRNRLPGAAATRRLAIVSRPGPESAAAPPVDPDGQPARVESVARPVPVAMPRIERSPDPLPMQPEKVAPIARDAPNFTLAAVVAGGCLWLEDLAGAPLATEQVQLVRAMAYALQRHTGWSGTLADSGEPEVTLFNWPVHNNRQLDLGEAAARAGLAGFIGRKLEQQHCNALILLGQQCASRVPLDLLGDVPVVSTSSSVEMLTDQALKKQAWTDLLPLARQS